MTTTPTRFAWFALRVHARHEMTVADFLEGSGYESFLPLCKYRKRWSDRIREVRAPLFPGYLFCRFDPAYRLPILKTPGVTQIVGYNRIPVPVDEAEIHAIRTLVTSGLPNQPWPFLEVGDPVRIESGPLRGLEGKILEFKGSQRLVLSITLLRRSVAAEVDSAFVTSLRTTPAASSEKPLTRHQTLQLTMS